MKTEVRKLVAALLVNFALVTYRGEFDCILNGLPPITQIDPTYGIKRQGFSYVQDGALVFLAPPSLYAHCARN